MGAVFLPLFYVKGMIVLKYDFNQVLDRKDSNSIKWNMGKMEYGTDDILPMWVADMDFKVADEILNALREPTDHGIIGYDLLPDSFFNSIINWIYNKYKWNVEKEWISFIPGIVPGISVATNAFTKEDDEILIQPPVYHPFYRVAENNGRKIVENPLKLNNEKYDMDFQDMKDKITERTKLAVLCSPHNPVGRVWTRDDLEEFGNTCIDKGLIIVSDEIHCDLTFKGHEHIPTAAISEDLAMNTITLMAPSKSFNIPGLFASVAIIPNKDIRNKFNKKLEQLELTHANTFSVAGFTAAYNHGGQWLEQALKYMEENADYAVEFINENIKGVKTYKPEGTYLLWLDFNELAKTPEELNNLLIEKGKVMLNNGEMFGHGGQGFFRLNIGCPRKTLEDGLKRIKQAVE